MLFILVSSTAEPNFLEVQALSKLKTLFKMLNNLVVCKNNVASQTDALSALCVICAAGNAFALV